MKKQVLVIFLLLTSMAAAESGWSPAAEEWTYKNTNGPMFNASIHGDVTYIYSPGLKIKLVQDDVIKYFILMDAYYEPPNTVLYLYGGTDYSLTRAPIDSPCYSRVAVPAGFPMKKDKWTILKRSDEDKFTFNPAANVWYNNNTVNLTIPAGYWKVGVSCVPYFYRTTPGDATIDIQLRTWTGRTYAAWPDFEGFRLLQKCWHSGSGLQQQMAWMKREEYITVPSKTTLYLVYRCGMTKPSCIGLHSASVPTLAWAECGYL